MVQLVLSSFLWDKLSHRGPKEMSRFIQKAAGSLLTPQEMDDLIFSSNALDGVGHERVQSTNCIQEYVGVKVREESFNYRDFEVIQHLKAMDYLFTEVVTKEGKFTENTIVMTYKLLFDEVDKLGGIYRGKNCVKHIELDGNRVQTAPNNARASIKVLLSDLQQEVDIARNFEEAELDPYELAARYHLRLLKIEPFTKANGKMARLLMNSLLLRYAGHTCSIGLTQSDIETYHSIVERGVKAQAREEIKRVAEGAWECHHELARFIATKSEKYLSKMVLPRSKESPSILSRTQIVVKRNSLLGSDDDDHLSKRTQCYT